MATVASPVGSPTVSPSGPPDFIRWLNALIDPTHTTEVLIAIATVAVVVWTAGFVVRSLGHRPNRGLIAGMNYAQLAFMGALVATFLTPIALQAIAVMFLVQELWTTTSIFMTWRRPANERTYGQQQLMDLYGLASGQDVFWYLFLEAPYVIAIITIIVWPTKIVALPLLWLGLYGSYQILISFLYTPSGQSSPTASPPASAAPAALLSSFKVLDDLHQNLDTLLNNTAVMTNYFTGREQDHAEAKNALLGLKEAAFAMMQYQIVSQAQPPGSLLASGYVQALSAHRAGAARLYTLVLGYAYQPRVAMSVLDEIRSLAFYDHAALSGNAQTGHFVANGNDVTVQIKSARLDTVTRSFSLAWLGEVYCEEANTMLLEVNGYLLNPPPSDAVTQPSQPTSAPALRPTGGENLVRTVRGGGDPQTSRCLIGFAAFHPK